MVSITSGFADMFTKVTVSSGRNLVVSGALQENSGLA